MKTVLVNIVEKMMYASKSLADIVQRVFKYLAYKLSSLECGHSKDVLLNVWYNA